MAYRAYILDVDLKTIKREDFPFLLEKALELPKSALKEPILIRPRGSTNYNKFVLYDYEYDYMEFFFSALMYEDYSFPQYSINFFNGYKIENDSFVPAIYPPTNPYAKVHEICRPQLLDNFKILKDGTFKTYADFLGHRLIIRTWSIVEENIFKQYLTKGDIYLIYHLNEHDTLGPFYEDQDLHPALNQLLIFDPENPEIMRICEEQNIKLSKTIKKVKVSTPIRNSEASTSKVSTPQIKKKTIDSFKKSDLSAILTAGKVKGRSNRDKNVLVQLIRDNDFSVSELESMEPKMVKMIVDIKGLKNKSKYRNKASQIKALTE